MPRWPTPSPPVPRRSSSARTSPARAACTASPAACSSSSALPRVFDTLLDEQAILGLGLGFGVSGLLPIPEIQYLAYLHNAEDQLRGEAASLRFFSNGTFRNPMVVRVAGLGYQKGFGGHFHNDNAVAVLRDIPGLVVAVPARPEDAAAMLRTCLAAASVDGTGVGVPRADRAVPRARPARRGRPRLARAILPRRARADRVGAHARRRRRPHDRDVRQRRPDEPARSASPGRTGIRRAWSTCAGSRPLPVDDLLREAAATGRVLVADETRHSGGVGEGVITALVEHEFTGRIARVASRDSFVPLGDAATPC